MLNACCHCDKSRRCDIAAKLHRLETLRHFLAHLDGKQELCRRIDGYLNREDCLSEAFHAA